jgi:UPF0755 protein
MFKRMIIILMVLVILALAAFVAGSNYYNQQLQPVEPEAVDDYRLIEIPSGANAALIGELLYEAGLIRNQQVFQLHVRRYNLGHRFIAGIYNLSPSNSADQIVEKLISGDIYADTIWFTIPEGFTVKEIAQRLEAKGLVESAVFLDFARVPSAGTLERFTFLKAVTDPEVEYLLEGYLFPDTYEVYPESGVEEIVGLMLSRLEQIVTAEDLRRIDQLNSSLHEILTIAAMVEREGRVDHERPLIAGIIYNRLEIGMLLQIDATIQYALGETKEFLTFKDLEIESPYNTYLFGGLPPGPIAAPGAASINAALYPEASDYLFYNYKYDGSGEHFFSHNLQEHLENVAKAEANLP